jgi:hypothetical protein
MAHGRKRSFLGGLVLGFALTLISILCLLYGLDITLGPPGYPHFTEKSARAATVEWARLNPFPPEVQSFTITTEGGMFTRAFRVSFFGEPSAVADWVQGCPGVADSKTTISESPDGTITFDIPAGGGATFAKLTHHPLRGTVSIWACWN